MRIAKSIWRFLFPLTNKTPRKMCELCHLEGITNFDTRQDKEGKWFCVRHSYKVVHIDPDTLYW